MGAMMIVLPAEARNIAGVTPIRIKMWMIGWIQFSAEFGLTSPPETDSFELNLLK
jgi:hypothetical protein